MTHTFLPTQITSFALATATLLTMACGDAAEPDKSSDGTAETIDKLLFSHIKKAQENSEKVWKGYKFDTYPMYLVHRAKESAAPTRGFLISSREVAGAKLIPEADAGGLKVYRYDAGLSKAQEALKKGNGVFEFEFDVEGHTHYLQAYTDAEVDRTSGSSSIELAFHEVFHQFQFGWTNPDGAVQEEDKYPLTQELLPLQLMTLAISKKMPGVTDTAEIDKYLSMYVAIRTEEIKQDPSPGKLVKNMANPQEAAEGSAKYVDFEVSKDLFDKFDATYDIGTTASITSKADARSFFAWGIWYATGAAAIYMLKKKGVDVEAGLKAGKTPFDLATTSLNLTEAQMSASLAAARAEFAFDTTLTEEAKRILALP